MGISHSPVQIELTLKQTITVENLKMDVIDLSRMTISAMYVIVALTTVILLCWTCWNLTPMTTRLLLYLTQTATEEWSTGRLRYCLLAVPLTH